MRSFSLLVALSLLTTPFASGAWAAESVSPEPQPPAATAQQIIAATAPTHETLFESLAKASFRPSKVVAATEDSLQVFDVTTPRTAVTDVLEQEGLDPHLYTTEEGKPLSSELLVEQGTTVYAFSVERKSTDETIDLPAPREEVESASLPKGTEVVLKKGQDGSAIRTTVTEKKLSENRAYNSSARGGRSAKVTESLVVISAPVPTQVLVGVGEPTQDEDQDKLVINGLLKPLGEAPVTSGYGMRLHPVTGVYKLHDGTDFSGACGTPVKAATGGTVIEASYLGGYGNQVAVDHGAGFVTSYSHLSDFTVSKGDTVRQGDTVGLVGSTGYSTGCHLHFMTLINEVTMNPLELLQQ